MITLSEIEYGSLDYEETCKLRDRIMRKPLGLSIENDDLSYEKDAIITVVKNEDCIIGTGILTYSIDGAIIRYVCVDQTIQKSGIGKMILLDLEEKAKSQGKKEIMLEARVSAKEFYKKYGYQEYGEEYLMDVAPVPHVVMKKKI